MIDYSLLSLKEELEDGLNVDSLGSVINKVTKDTMDRIRYICVNIKTKGCIMHPYFFPIFLINGFI